MALRRVLTATDAGWIVAGSMIGAGIFITPGFVARQLPGVFWPLLAWLFGGLVALAGALVYGELGARLPEAGGEYLYLAHTYGRLWGFMNGWAALTLTFSAAAAAQTRSALDYLVGVLPGLDSPRSAAFAAPIVVLLLSWANTAGARLANKATVLLTAGPIAILIGLFAVGVASGGVHVSWPERPFALPPGSLPVALGVAIVPIFFTYSGWNAASYLAGEMRDPGRGLARGLVAGTGLTTLLYLAMNLALIALLPQSRLAGSARPAAEAASGMLGARGEALLAVVIAMAILGSANVTLMAGARVYYAMARDGMAPAFLTRTNAAGVPALALWAGGLWSAGLSLVGQVQDLVNWATLAILLLSSMAVTTLFVLRRRDVGQPAFRCPGYPVTPVLYLLACAGAAVSSWLYDPRRAALGLAIVGAGFPVYAVCRRWFRQAA